MPDHTLMPPNEHSARPHGWDEAFAALPLETPDADAWQRLQLARTQHARKRWPAWFAAVAVLALAAMLPWQLTRTNAGAEIEVAAGTSSAARAERGAASGRPKAATDAPIASTAANEPVDATPAPASDLPIATLPAAKPSTARNPGLAATHNKPRPAQRQAETTASRSVAATTLSGALPDSGETHSPRPWPQPAADPQLERLYAQSAQLEALVALARDDRVATGTAATLTSAYDAQVASIDASLREPDMDAAQRTNLWQQRVDALRQLAGFETTQRALAAQGERYDAMLVSID